MATGLCAGTYSVVVTDSVGNEVTVFATVGVIPGIIYFTEEMIQFKAYPNPFTRATKISYTLVKQSQVRLELFNMLGELISIIENNDQIVGEYTYEINADVLSLSPGVYRIRLTLDNNVSFSKQLIELK